MNDQEIIYFKGHVELKVVGGQKLIHAVGDQGYPSQDINANDIFLGSKFFDGLVKKLNGK